MFILHANKKRWRISKDGHIVICGIGTAQQAIALARLHSIVLSHFYDLPKLESVA